MKHPKLYDSFGEPEEKKEPEKPTGFELLTKLVIPGLALGGFIIAQLSQQQALAWALLAVLGVSFALFLYSPVKNAVRTKINFIRDNRTSKNSVRQLRQFQRGFAEFVDPSTGRSDTLHYIAQHELCRSNTTDFERLRPVPVTLFNQWCWYLRARTARETPSLANLLDLIREFNSLVSFYTQYSVLPLFDQFPQELRHLLTDRAKSSLESFRERFDRFLHDYSEYLKNLDDTFTTPHVKSYYFPRPKPL